MRDLQPSMAARFGTHLWSRGFLKARIGPTTVAEIRLEQQKTEKISSILRTGERKGWTVSERRDNPDPGAGIICRLWNRRRHDKVSCVLPRRWRDYSALLACHEQTTHLGARPEKAAVAREIARASSREKSERWKLGGQISGVNKRIVWNPNVASRIS